MDNTQFDKNNPPVWLSITEASRLLNLKEKTVKDYCRNGKVNYKVELNNRTYNYFIRFDSLPNYAKYKIIPESQESRKKYSEAPDWAKIQAEKYIKIIQKSEDLKGEELKHFIKKWNIEHPQFKTSYPSVIKMRRRYNEDGVLGLLSRYGNNASNSTVK